MKTIFFFLLSLFYVQQCEAQKAVPPKFDKPTAIVYNRNEGMLYQPYLLHAKNIDVVSGNNSREEFVVNAYNVAIMRYNDTFFAMKNIQGKSFPKELKEAFKMIGHTGKLTFYSITAIGPDKKIIELAPMEFTITKK